MANLKDRLAIVFSKHTAPPQDDELVAFGKKHKGETFLEAWKDEAWVKWTAENLKPDGRDGPHTRWLEFVERQIKNSNHSRPVAAVAALCQPVAAVESQSWSAIVSIICRLKSMRWMRGCRPFPS